MDTEAAFARIRRAIEEFSTDVDKARAGQAESQEAIASVEYELAQLRKLIAEATLAN